MLTWKLWTLLHTPSKVYAKWLIKEDNPNAKQDVLIAVSIVIYPFLCSQFPLLLVPIALFLILNIFCLHIAWKISGIISKQIELRRWELLAATPRGTRGPSPERPQRHLNRRTAMHSKVPAILRAITGPQPRRRPMIPTIAQMR